MPHYEPAQVAGLLEGFAKAEGLNPTDESAEPARSAADADRGWGMLGTSPEKSGMACVSCHDWGDKKAQGEHGPDLLSAGERLRYEWFHRWMRDPSRVLSGTSMPNYFSSTPPAQADETIRVFWAALKKAPDLPLPEGFQEAVTGVEQELRPKPDNEAVVVRWEMPEATPGAFAVGLPGGVSYCFDSVECRMRYAWTGPFIDLSRSLSQKVEEDTRYTVTAEVRGEIFFRSDEIGFRIDEPGRIPLRRFRGYRLIDSIPEFHYDLDGIGVREATVPAGDGRGLVQKFTIESLDQPAWYLLPEGANVVITSSLGGRAGERVELPQGRDVRFEVRIGRGPQSP
jgi:hypothetical protein